MTHRFRLAALMGGTVLALALPVAARASTKTVYMGEPPKYANTFEQKYSSDVNNFFPHSITVHVGDRIRFIRGFHTVDFPARGQKSLDLVAPTSQVVNGANDAAGQPFWFDGKVNQLTFNPLVLKTPARATYTGARRADSGLSTRGKPTPFTVRFLKKGTFTYYCDVHPGMKGIVHVVARGKRIPTAVQDALAIKRQVAADLVEAKHVSQTTPPTGTVLVGAGGPGNVDYYGFLGPKSPIKVGTTLRFQIGSGSLETHTASTDTVASNSPPAGPPNFTIPSPYLANLASTFESAGPFDPIATYPSDPAGGTPASLSSTLHGNGFWNSGALDNARTTPLPSNASVRFDTPGTYRFYCLIHSFMTTTITVQ